MEKCSTVFLGTLVLLGWMPGPARADPPTMTVWFGAPVDAPREPATRAVREEPPWAPEPVAAAPPPLPVVPSVPELPRASREAESRCPPAVTVVRRHRHGLEQLRMPLLACDGRPSEDAQLALSLLARARTVERAPTVEAMQAWREAEGDPELLAEGVHRIHPGLLERLQRVGETFDPSPIEIVSGYRPESAERSRHHHGRALDIVVQGVAREALRDLVATFPQTGVGWYPNSTFVHIDVREESAYWVDLSGPGERPRYVRGAAPPLAEQVAEPSVERLERAEAPVQAPTAPWTATEPPADRLPASVQMELERLRALTSEALRGLQAP